MKALCLLIAISSLSATGAFARSYRTVVDKAMSLEACTATIQRYAAGKRYTIEQWQPNDYYLLEGGEKVGNAYYSSGRCYIYLDQ